MLALLLAVMMMAPAQTKTAQLAPQSPPQAQAETAPVAPKPALTPTAKPAPIRFEDATEASGIHFTHSMGSQALGSLLEATGGGCVWFDYNNDGLLDLYVVSGKPLEDSMHPHPLKVKPDPPPHNHLYRNNGDGTFTDVTQEAGVAPDMYSFAVTAADYRQRRLRGLAGDGLRQGGALPQQRQRNLYRRDGEGWHQGRPLVDQLGMAGL